ncbi:hypothetical protein BWQ96_10632 [Gracilariopsis chorda]|uniref:Uncharacterized protein n=1 Tax=Gracilariopsis chorda TaxID=448386 RepID=A0A2V3IC41_9FLOR|nr:hypothetical protein BWQ96_10632 [Gracilariopsis chorda]|eukprot:PXF39665.1 hypothetical protein BWQ96_10632 [Gracilariopsis chorda]
MKTCEAVQTMQISTKRVDLLVDILRNVTSKNMDEQVVERAVECMRTLKAATQEHRKSCRNDERSSRTGLQDAIQALEEIKLEEKYLQNPASKEPKPESATKSFLGSNKFNKKMKKRRRISHEEIERTSQNRWEIHTR